MQEEFFICPYCNNSYDTKTGVSCHITKSHYKEKVRADVLANPFLCPYCDKSFKTLKTVVLHANYVHNIPSEQTVLKLTHNDEHPVCKCGCGEQTNYNKNKFNFRDYCKGHVARVNNNYVLSGGVERSVETRKQRAAQGLYKGIPKSEEHREKIRQKSLLHKHSDVSKEKMSESKTKWNKENPEKVNLHMKTYWKDPSHRAEQRERRYVYFKTQQMTLCKMEKVFSEFLTELSILHERQFRLERRLFDFKLENTNILIETDGDFWHSNPAMFPLGPIYKAQKTNYERDILKNQLAKDKGYKLLRFWESDIKYNLEEVKKILLKEIELSKV